MKFFLALSVFALTSAAFATDFSAKIDDINCSIVNGVVTRTVSFGKENIGSFTETKTVKMEGLAPFIQKTIEVATQVPGASDAEYVYTMKHEGKTYYITTEDSRETMALVRMISKICR